AGASDPPPDPSGLAPPPPNPSNRSAPLRRRTRRPGPAPGGAGPDAGRRVRPMGLWLPGAPLAETPRTAPTCRFTGPVERAEVGDGPGRRAGRGAEGARPGDEAIWSGPGPVRPPPRRRPVSAER